MTIAKCEAPWPAGNAGRWRRLVVCCVAMGLIWCVVLPRLACREPLRSSIQYLDDRGIDPSAMYYTDLEGMTRVQAEIDRKRRTHPEAFWQAYDH